MKESGQINTKKNSTERRYFFELTLVLSVVTIPLCAHAGFFNFLLPVTPSLPSDQAAAVFASSPIDLPLLSAGQNPDPVGGIGGAEIIVNEDTLVSSGPVGEDQIAESKLVNGEIRVYTVREGDSLSQIAEMFDVTTNTILWANDLKSAKSIQPGETLVILPIVGVRHVVKSGDTISTIAKKYEGDEDEILAYNQLPDSSAISVGDVVIVPGGAMHQAPVVATSRATSGGGGGGSAGFAHPVPGAIKTQGIHGYNAVDLAAGYGTPIRAAAGGEVIVSKSGGWNGGYGNYIVIRHGNGTQTLYAHLAQNYVGVGAYVGQSETIGTMGNSGRSTGTHLHFEVRGARNPF